MKIEEIRSQLDILREEKKNNDINKAKAISLLETERQNIKDYAQKIADNQKAIDTVPGKLSEMEAMGAELNTLNEDWNAMRKKMLNNHSKSNILGIKRKDLISEFNKLKSSLSEKDSPSEIESKKNKLEELKKSIEENDKEFEKLEKENKSLERKMKSKEKKIEELKKKINVLQLEVDPAYIEKLKDEMAKLEHQSDLSKENIQNLELEIDNINSRNNYLEERERYYEQLLSIVREEDASLSESETTWASINEEQNHRATINRHEENINKLIEAEKIKKNVLEKNLSSINNKVLSLYAHVENIEKLSAEIDKANKDWSDAHLETLKNQSEFNRLNMERADLVREYRELEKAGAIADTHSEAIARAKRLKELETKILELDTNISKLEAREGKLSSLMRRSEKLIKKNEGLIEDEHNAIQDELNNNTNTLHAQIERYNVLIHVKSINLNSYQKEREKLVEEYNELMSATPESIEDKNKIAIRLNELQTQIDDIDVVVEEMSSSLRNAQSAINLLEHQIQINGNVLENYRDDPSVISEYESDIQVLRNQIQAVNERIETMNNQIHELDNDLEQSNQQEADMRGRVSTMDENVENEFGAMAQGIEDNTPISMDDIQNGLSEIEFRTMMNEKRYTILKLESDSKAVKIDIGKLQEEIRTLQINPELNKDAIQEKLNKVADLQSRLQNINIQKQKEIAEAQRFGNSVQKIKDEYNNRLEPYNNIKKEVDALTLEKDELEKTIERLENTEGIDADLIAQRKNEYNLLVANLTAKAGDLATAQTRLQEYQERFPQIVESVNREDTRQAISSDKAMLERMLQDQKIGIIKREALKKEIQDLENNPDADKDLIAEKKSELKVLNNQLQNVRKVIRNKKIEIKKNQNNIRDISLEEDSVKAKELEQISEKYKKEIEDIKSNIEVLEKEIDDISKEDAPDKEALKAKREQLKKLQKELKNKTMFLDYTNSDLQNLNASIDARLHEIEAAETRDRERRERARREAEARTPHPEAEPELAPERTPLSNSMGRNIGLNKARKAGAIGKFLDNVCGTVQLDEQGEYKYKSKKRRIAELMVLSAKFALASTLFGPFVGGWMVAHYNNNEYFSKKEAKAFKAINTFSMNGNLIDGPTVGK